MAATADDIETNPVEACTQPPEAATEAEPLLEGSPDSSTSDGARRADMPRSSNDAERPPEVVYTPPQGLPLCSCTAQIGSLRKDHGLMVCLSCMCSS
jgi:hypothetical protein